MTPLTSRCKLRRQATRTEQGVVMRLVVTVLSVVAVFQSFTCLATTMLAADSPRTMALTFDDLPYAAAAQGNTVTHARRVSDAILAALERYHAPATAFVNEGKLHVTGEVDERSALLQQWVDAGAILGNHTFSHVDINSVTVAEFKEEIIKGEIITNQLMQPREPYQLYFRHPYTHTGESEAKKLEVDRFLISRGYKVAPHTIDSQDHIFNRVYLLSNEQGDDATAMRICEAYLDFVVRATEFAEDVSAQIFGRSIPQTLLLHANDINADCLDELLDRFIRREYEFVSLDAAMSDRAYETQDTFVTTYGPTWLWRWMKSQGMNVSFRGDPEPPNWITDLFRQASPAAQDSQ